MLRELRVESCAPQVRGLYTDGKLTLDVAALESGLLRELRNQHPRLGLHTQRFKNGRCSLRRLSKIAHMRRLKIAKAKAGPPSAEICYRGKARVFDHSAS